MSAAQEILARLTSAAASLGIVAEVWQGNLPAQVVYPAIQFRLSGGSSIAHLTGESELQNPEYQIDCYARTIAVAEALATTSRMALVNNPTATFGAVAVNHPFENYADDAAVYRLTYSVAVWV